MLVDTAQLARTRLSMTAAFSLGTLAIDVFDGRTHRPEWHGWAQKELTRKDLEQSVEPINKAVSTVLAKFPPGRDSSCHQRGSECVS